MNQSSSCIGLLVILPDVKRAWLVAILYSSWSRAFLALNCFGGPSDPLLGEKNPKIDLMTPPVLGGGDVSILNFEDFESIV